MSQNPKTPTKKVPVRTAKGKKAVPKPSNREFEVVEPKFGPVRFTWKQIRDAVALVNKREAAKAK
jgi:hypothetical protein